MTTLCKPDSETIEKTKSRFRDMVGKLMHENPEFRGHLMVGNERIGKRHDIEFSGQKISVVRLEWTIIGDRHHDLPEAFFRKWKERDENPLRSFHVKPDYSLSEIKTLMKIDEERNSMPDNLKPINIPEEMFTWKPDENDIKGLMETLRVSKQEIAEGLDIPLQRVTAAITKPRKGTYMPNPHAQSTRTLIMLYLNSAPWREVNGNRRDDKRC